MSIMTRLMRSFWIVGFSLVLMTTSVMSGQEVFRARTADKYPGKEKQEKLIVAVKPFLSEKDQKRAFGNVRLLNYGFVPLLIVLTNTGKSSFELKNLKVRLITPDRESLEPFSGEDLATFNPSGHQPTSRNIPGLPGLNKKRVKKGPLNRPEIMNHEFLAPIITPESTASGFLYYSVGDVQSLRGYFAYISGIMDLSTGRELFYFEIPLDKL